MPSLTGRQAALSENDFDQRFAAIQRLYGTAGLEALRALHICVVGVGGVGSWAVEALARTGVGKITFIDNDEVSPGNTNRQIHALTGNFGQPKVGVLAQRVAQINPDCECNAIDDFLTMRTLERYLVSDYDHVIDAIDSIKFKSAMIAYCRRRKISVTVTGGAGGRTDPTAIQTSDLSRSYNDALLAKVRAQLRKDYGFTSNPRRRFGVRCVFSSQQPVYPREDGSVGPQKPGQYGVSLDCRFGYGSATFVTATFGFVAVSEAIQSALRRRLMRR